MRSRPACLNLVFVRQAGLSRLAPLSWTPPHKLGGATSAATFSFYRKAWARVPGFCIYQNFSLNRDDRMEMLDWIDGNLQPGSKVLADQTVLLPRLLSQSKQKYRFAIAGNELAKLQEGQSVMDHVAASGVDYIVASPADYSQLFSRSGSVATVNEPSLNAEKQFYSDLFKHGTLVWKREPGPVPFLQPGLEIYHLPRPVN